MIIYFQISDISWVWFEWDKQLLVWQIKLYILFWAPKKKKTYKSHEDDKFWIIF
jgi:hypothetical protein